jgi:hypothetical protein
MKFISDISLFWLIPIGAIAFLLTYLFYRKEAWLNEISTWTKKSLFTLRFLSLFFIGILLLGILFESFSYRKEKPIFITLVDNSHSLKNFKDSANVAQRIADFNSKIKEKFSEKFELDENFPDQGQTKLSCNREKTRNFARNEKEKPETSLPFGLTLSLRVTSTTKVTAEQKLTNFNQELTARNRS